MKFTLTRSVAVPILSQALKTCNIKAKGEVDSEFLFRIVDDAKLSLQVTSINDFCQQSIKLPCEGTVDEGDLNDGFSVSGQAVVEFLKQFPEETIECNYSSAKGVFMMRTTSKKTQFAFPTGHPDDFALFDFQKKGSPFSADGVAISNALKLTAFCASTDSQAAPYTAVKLRMADTALVAQSSDKERISLVQLEIDDVGGDAIELLLPKISADILSSLLSDVAIVTLVPGNRHIRFEWDDTTFTSALESGLGRQFPDLSKFFAGTEAARVKVSRDNLLRSLKLSSLVAKDSCITVTINKDGLSIAAQDDQRGASYDTVVVQETSGDAETTVACRYFIKAVETTTGAWVAVVFHELPNNTNSLVVEDDSYAHLVFPVAPNQPSGDSDGGDTDGGA